MRGELAMSRSRENDLDREHHMQGPRGDRKKKKKEKMVMREKDLVRGPCKPWRGLALSVVRCH